MISPLSFVFMGCLLLGLRPAELMIDLTGSRSQIILIASIPCRPRRPAHERDHGFVRGPDQLIHIGWRAFLGRYVTADRGERRLDHRVGDHPDGTRIRTAAEAPAEGAKLGFSLSRE